MKGILQAVLFEILGFVLLCVLGVTAGALLHAFYGASTSYVAGGQMSLSPQEFVNGILIVLPPLLLFVPMFRMLSLVRHHSKNRAACISTLCVLSACSWIFGVPVCAKALLANGAFSKKDAANLTSGYFRNLNGETHYWVNASENYADGIKFENDDDKKNVPSRKVEYFKNEFVPHERDENGFSDPIVGSELKPPSVVSVFLKELLSVEMAAFKACSSGGVAWLCFSSIMAAVLAGAALVAASGWRLVCAFWIFFCTFAVILLNYLYLNFYFAPFLSNFSQMGFLFVFLKNNFQPVMNLTIAFVLIAAGVFCTIFRKKNFSGADE